MYSNDRYQIKNYAKVIEYNKWIYLKIINTIPVKLIRLPNEEYLTILNNKEQKDKLLDILISNNNSVNSEFKRHYFFKKLTPILSAINKIFKFIYPLFVLAFIALIIFDIIFIKKLNINLSISFFTFLFFLIIYASLLFLTVFHEYIHALIINLFGGDVDFIGIRFFPIPSGLTDFSDIFFINSARKRFLCYFSGILFWLFIGIIDIFLLIIINDKLLNNFFSYHLIGIIIALIFVCFPYPKSDLMMSLKSLVGDKNV